jgi:predicted transcriptional regulator
MVDKFNANSFGTFLETVQRTKSSARTATVIDLLRILEKSPEHQLDASTLLAQSTLSVATFAQMLNELESAGLLTRTALGAQEIMALTDRGLSMARLAG